jgi:hypothetical protein
VPHALDDLHGCDQPSSWPGSTYPVLRNASDPHDILTCSCCSRERVT